MSEQMNNNTRNEVADGTYDCVIVSAKRADSEKAIKHFIVSLGVRKADDIDAMAYWCNLPLCFAEGEKWYFYDADKKMNVERPATQDDTAAAWEYARKCFPAWAEYCDNLDENAGLKAAVDWFGSEHSKEVVCKAKLSNKDGTDANGNPKRKHYASVYEIRGKGVDVDDDENERFAKSLAASGIQIGKRVARAAKANAAPAKKAPAPAAPAAEPKAPAAPSAPAKPAKEYTAQDAWDAYEKYQKRVDPDGSNYWNRVAVITGKVPADWRNFTSDDWRKCVEDFTKDF